MRVRREPSLRLRRRLPAGRPTTLRFVTCARQAGRCAWRAVGQVRGTAAPWQGLSIMRSKHV